MTRFLFAVVALGALASATASSAATIRVTDTGNARVATVRYADLDLASRDGAHALIQRVRQAADAVCGGAPSLASLNDQDRYQACVGRTVDGAVQQLNSPLVSRLYTSPAPATLASR